MTTSRALAIIPDGPKFYEFSSSLDGENYYLKISYNERIDTWHLTLRDSDRNILVQGLPCLTNSQNMIQGYALEGVLPFGEFLIFDISSLNAQDSTKETFGENQKMYYLSVADD